MPLGLGRPSPPCANHASSGGMPRIQPADTTGILQLSPDSRPPPLERRFLPSYVATPSTWNQDSGVILITASNIISWFRIQPPCCASAKGFTLFDATTQASALGTPSTRCYADR